MHKLALAACSLLSIPAALAIRGFRNRPVPVPASAATPPAPAARAAIALAKTSESPAPEPAPPNSIVALPHSLDILEMVAAPTRNELLLAAQSGKDSSGEPDAYGGILYHVRWNGADLEAHEIVSGNNVVSASTPVWDPSGAVAYFIYDNGSCAPMGTGTCGIFTLEPQTGKMQQLLADSTQGLAISRDGSFLAFWDFTTGDKLTVLNVKTKAIVKEWAGEKHGAGDLVVSDVAFAPDAKSVFALTYAASETPLKQFDLETGKVRTVSRQAQSLIGAADGVYFLQADAKPADPQRARKLMMIASSNSEPETMLENFPYAALRSSGNRRWLTAATGSGKGIAIYDAQDKSVRAPGSNCQHAAVLADGQVAYAARGHLTLDPAACGAIPARPAASK